jgi:hypothetical protein
MDSLNIQLFYVPSVAFILIIGCYFYYSKKVDDKKSFNAFFWNVALFAYLFNLIWEVSQGFLYEGYIYDLDHIAFCALATVADVFMVFLLYFAYSLLYKNVYWFRQLNFTKAFFLILIGGLGAVFGETKHLAAGNWAYADSMPLLPIVNVGFTPVLQFMILPLLIYWVSFERQKAITRTEGSASGHLIEK